MTDLEGCVLRSALGLELGPSDADATRDPRLVRIALANVSIRRVDAAFQTAGITPNADLARVADAERERVLRLADLVTRIASACAERGIPAVFPKAFQHWPDMGHDVDVLVDDDTGETERCLIALFGARPARRGVFDVVADKKAFVLARTTDPVEVHHGRLGRTGDLRAFARDVVARRRSIRVDGFTADVPSMEDQLVIQVIQRIYDHFSIRLSDAAHTLRLAALIDSASVARTSGSLGLGRGLRAYATAVSHITRPSLGDELVAPLAAYGTDRSKPHRWRRNDGRYVVPFSTIVRLYAHRISSRIRTGDLEGAGRLASTAPLGLIALSNAAAARIVRRPSFG